MLTKYTSAYFENKTKTAYDLRVCDDLKTRSFVQGQGRKVQNTCPVYIFLGQILKILNSYKDCF